MAEHPGYLKVPAIMVPHGSPPPWPWGGARARPPQAVQAPAPEVEPRVPGSFAPPPKRRKRQPGGQPWPKDKNGRNWPQDRWGRPMRPLWDYPPGVRAPGEGVAPGEPGSISTADAIDAYLKAEAVFANPMGIRDAVSTARDPANLYAYVGNDPLNKTDPSGLCAQAGCGNADPSTQLIPSDNIQVAANGGTPYNLPAEIPIGEIPVAQDAGIDVARFNAGAYQSILSEHGPDTNRIGPNSVFDPSVVADYDTFVNQVLIPAFSSTTATVTSPRWGQLQWTAALPQTVGTGLSGARTSNVTIVLQYNWALSLNATGTNIWSITGVYPR
jgi:hypothetical protein